MKDYALSLLLMLSVSAFSYAQEVEVDYKQISEYIANNQTDYEALLQRYEANDSLLVLQDYATVYYGHSFTSSYRGSMETFSEMDDFIKEKKLEEAFEWGKNYRKQNPVSLRLLALLYGLGKELGKDPAELNGYITKVIRLLHVISSSGDGQSAETAFKVICVNDEYQLMRILRVKMVQQSLIGNCDMIEIEPTTGYNGTQIWFDVSRSLNYTSNLFSK